VCSKTHKSFSVGSIFFPKLRGVGKGSTKISGEKEEKLHEGGDISRVWLFCWKGVLRPRDEGKESARLRHF